MKWREHAYEWIEERRMGILREFDTGPSKWFTSVLEFLPTANGRTRLIHSLKILPNGWFGRQFATLKMGRTTHKTLTKIYQRIDAVLQAVMQQSRPLIHLTPLQLRLGDRRRSKDESLTSFARMIYLLRF